MKSLYFKNGDSFPQIGLGTWLSKKSEVYDAVINAVKAGYRHIDCAYIYRNEHEIGEAIRFLFDKGMVKREDLFITSKLWNNSHRAEDVEKALRQTLTDLQLDYLDLYLIHWPIASKTEQVASADDLISLKDLPLSQTWDAMVELKSKNLVKHAGVSNFNIPKLESLKDCSEMPEANQIEVHPYFQQNELVEYCQKNDIIVTAYSPLGSSHLVRTDDSIVKNPTVLKISEKHKCTPAQVVLAWGLKRKLVEIPKSVNPQRITDNFGALFVSLDDEDMAVMAGLNRNVRNAKGLFAVVPDGPYTYESIWNE